MFTINNSRDNEYHIQIDNKRSPSIACFPTSMINSAYVAKIPVKQMMTYHNDIYNQDEDIYDAYIHTPEIIDYIMNDNELKRAYTIDKTDPREMWKIEEYAFNKFIGKNVCSLDFDLTMEKILYILYNGGAIATSGLFYKFHHVVSIVGYECENSSFAKDYKSIKNIIIDDSYGNVQEKYSNVGMNGNNDSIPILDFLRIISKTNRTKIGPAKTYEEALMDKYWGIVFNKFIN